MAVRVNIALTCHLPKNTAKQTKLKLLILGICVIAEGTTKVNAQAFKKGDNIVKAGYGFPTIYGTLFSTYESNNDYEINSFGPLYIKYEHALTDKIGLGLNFAYTTNIAEFETNSNGNDYDGSVQRTSYSVLARFNFHFATSEKFDPYFGPSVGYRKATWKFKSEDPNYINTEFPNLIPFGMELVIGANYFITDNVGLYTELGFAKSPVQFGAAFKF